jgi:predicted short-subunit dehydrogenase-like oxidoreductase (DUF2520 family)
MDDFFDSVSFVGAGNVATHLALNLKKQGIQIHSITSKNNQSAKVLASVVESKVIEDLNLLPPHCLVIICVNDESIRNVIQKIPLINSIVYTSGNIELKSLPKRANLGVFYPLQTFTKDRDLNLSNVPFLIESNNELFGKKIFDLASKLSNHVLYANSAERKKIHLGAVFVNNFTNHLLFLSKNYIDSQQLNWDILKPLMQETIDKLSSIEPFEAQTGPARRNDVKIIENHLQELDGRSKEIYELISKSIIETYQSK